MEESKRFSPTVKFAAGQQNYTNIIWNQLSSRAAYDTFFTEFIWKSRIRMRAMARVKGENYWYDIIIKQYFLFSHTPVCDEKVKHRTESKDIALSVNIGEKMLEKNFEKNADGKNILKK